MDSSSGGGTHWVAMKNDKNKLLYFDSFGLPPPEEIKQFNKKIVWNTSQLQHTASSKCGFYCIYFINELAKGKELYDVIYNLDQFTQHKNEKMMEKYFSS
jgi:hypothetical protein